MIIFMIHMIAFEARLRGILGFEEFEFLSEVDEIRGANEGKVEIISLEDIIYVEGLDLIN